MRQGPGVGGTRPFYMRSRGACRELQHSKWKEGALPRPLVGWLMPKAAGCSTLRHKRRTMRGEIQVVGGTWIYPNYCSGISSPLGALRKQGPCPSWAFITWVVGGPHGLGGGHQHLHILYQWAGYPEHGVTIAKIDPFLFLALRTGCSASIGFPPAEITIED